ncbi:MAG: putative ABC transporter permease [Bacilli bacterium]
MEYNLTIIFLSFLIYSIIGWILEVIVCSMESKKIVNRGFLFGPYCPVYGLGALAILVTLLRYEEDPIVVFVFGVLITSAIEYYTSYILEKIFHNKWWDYSDRIDSINGRICVGNMIAFGFCACAVIYIFQPLLMNLFEIVSMQVLNIISIVLALLFTADVIYSIVIAYALRNRIIVAEELKAEKLRMLPGIIEKTLKEKLTHLNIKKIRFFKSFPDLKNNYETELDEIKKWIDRSNKKKKKRK